MSDVEKQDHPHQNTQLPIRFRRIGVCILVVGLLGATLVYFTATDARYGAIGYESIGGHSYAVMPGDSKSYQYELERIGGKSAVMAADMNTWWASLWHGRRLAYTLAFLSIGACVACFILAHLLTLQPWPDDTEDRGG
jgi:hypothetical protein